MLADGLKEILEGDQSPSNEAIHGVFSNILAYQKPRATKLMQVTMALQRGHALENQFLRYIQLKIVPHLKAGDLSSIYAAGSTPSHSAKYLPKNFETGVVPANEDVLANPSDRSSLTTKIWIAVMLLIALVGPAAKALLGLNHTEDPNESRVLQTYLLVISIAVNGVWVLESHRPGRWTSLLLYT